MSGVIRWEEPAPAKQLDWFAIAAELATRPGEWALVATYPAMGTASTMAKRIRQGGVPAMPTGFEAVARDVDDEYRIYARLVGEPSPEVKR